MYSTGCIQIDINRPAADPGFSHGGAGGGGGGGANFPGGGGGCQHTNFAKFSKKLHEIERIWVPRGGGVPPAPP